MTHKESCAYCLFWKYFPEIALVDCANDRDSIGNDLLGNIFWKQNELGNTNMYLATSLSPWKHHSSLGNMTMNSVTCLNSHVSKSKIVFQINSGVSKLITVFPS